MASIDVGIYPDPAGITTRRFEKIQGPPFSILEFNVRDCHARVYVHNRPTLDALQAALDEIRADMDQAAQTASDQTPTVMADWRLVPADAVPAEGRRPEDDAECDRLGCEDRTHPVYHRPGARNDKARAVAAERARIAEAVRGLRGYETPDDIEFGTDGYVYDPTGVMRAAVLAIVEKP